MISVALYCLWYNFARVHKLRKSPGFQTDATLPYLPRDTLALGFGGSRSLGEITIDQVRRVVAQFSQELEAIAPPKKVRDHILDVLDRLKQTEKQDELVMMWRSMASAILGLIQWLHG